MEKLDLILQKITEMDSKITEMDSKITELDKKFETRFDKMENRMNKLEVRMDNIALQQKALEIKTDAIQNDVLRVNDTLTDLNLRVEKEVIFGIKVIGEGHSDLNRKFREAEKDKDEREMLLLRLVRVESDIVRINERCSKCA